MAGVFACASAALAGDAAYTAGFAELSLADGDRSRTIPVALWYPTSASEAPIAYTRVKSGAAAAASAPAAGRWPLVIWSHGSLGNRFNQSILAETLARHGFITAALEHPGDRTFDGGDSRTVRNLLDRPLDVVFVLDALLSDAGAFAAFIDGDRIAAAGHSAGGFTAVVVAGGSPDMASLEAYCARYRAADPDNCPAEGALPNDERERAFLDGALELSDPRVRAAVLMAPAIGPLFDASGLAGVTVPVLMFVAASDEVLNEPLNSRPYASGLARLRQRTLPAIGHFTFLDVCGPLLAAAAPEICRDPPGVDRAAVLAAIAAETAAFLQQALDR